MKREHIEGDVITQIRDGFRTTLIVRLREGTRVKFESFYFRRSLPWFRGRRVQITKSQYVIDVGPSTYCVRLHAEIKRLLNCGVAPLALTLPPRRLLCIRPSGSHAWLDFKDALATSAVVVVEEEVNMAAPRALAEAVHDLLARADAETDALVIIRGGGDNVAALDHVEVAMALFTAARSLPTILAVGHSADRLRVDRVLHSDLVMSVPAYAGRYIADLHRNEQQHLPLALPAPALATTEWAEQVFEASGDTVPCLEQQPEPQRVLAPLTHITTTAVQLAIGEMQDVPMVPAPVAQPYRSAMLTRWKTALALLGGLYLLVLGVMAVVRIAGVRSQTPAEASTAADTASSPSARNAPGPASSATAKSRRADAVSGAEPMASRVRATRPTRKKGVATETEKVGQNVPPTAAPVVSTSGGRTIIQAPSPHVHVQESPLLRRY